jgi:hypothetical protein|eukprot:COSAG06_NODE_81_length_25302_cov_21.168902_4_plen_756_part_00
MGDCPNYYGCSTNESPTNPEIDPCSCASFCGTDTRCCLSTHFDTAIADLEQLEAHYSGQSPITNTTALKIVGDRVADAIMDGVAQVAPGSFDLTALSAVALAQASSQRLVPTIDSPTGPESPGDTWLLTAVLGELASTGPVETLPALPAAAAEFPGTLAAPNADALASTVVPIDATYRGRDGWYSFSGSGTAVMRSTGLWAKAGEAITVQVPAAAAGQGLKVLIGCHTDTLGTQQAKRFRKLTRSFGLATTSTVAASSFGGLVYITIPGGKEIGEIDVTILDAYAAPYFRLGHTTDEEWNQIAKHYPAPWAELQGPNFIITVQSAEAQRVESPTALMEFWERVLSGSAALEGYPSDWQRDRPERFVMDVHIGGGWMHSGYPMMGYQSASWDALLNFYSISTTAEAWGPFHELGHNFQATPWTWHPTIETGCNLWSVYILDVVMNSTARHNALSPDRVLARKQEYFENGPQYASKWETWFALDTMLDLQSEFGWDLFSQVFASYRYRKAEGIEDYNGMSNADKMNAWVLRTSHVAGVNLGPFYLRWGFPVSTEVLDEVALLPDWNPRGSVVSSLTIGVDIGLIPAGSSARQAFDTNFKTDMAATLGVDASQVHVWNVSAASGDSCTVDFAIVPNLIDGSILGSNTVNTALGGGSVTFASLSSQDELSLGSGPLAVTLGAVSPPPQPSCADANADGDTADTHDCTCETNSLHASPATVTCAGNPCTATECCTVVPPPPPPPPGWVEPFSCSNKPTCK